MYLDNKIEELQTLFLSMLLLMVVDVVYVTGVNWLEIEKIDCSLDKQTFVHLD